MTRCGYHEYASNTGADLGRFGKVGATASAGLARIARPDSDDHFPSATLHSRQPMIMVNSAPARHAAHRPTYLAGRGHRKTNNYSNSIPRRAADAAGLKIEIYRLGRWRDSSAPALPRPSRRWPCTAWPARTGLARSPGPARPAWPLVCTRSKPRTHGRSCRRPPLGAWPCSAARAGRGWAPSASAISRDWKTAAPRR